MQYKLSIKKNNEDYFVLCSHVMLSAMLADTMQSKFIKITIEPYKESLIDLEKSNYERIK